MSSALARAVGRAPSKTFQEELVRTIFREDPKVVLAAVGPELNRKPTLSRMPLDLAPEGRLDFEDLAGLFMSNPFNHGIVGMTIRQLAYVFGLTRRSGVKRAIEIGRWRGGTTIALAAAMGDGGKLWSIDVGEKEARVFHGRGTRFDDETREFLERFGFDVDLIVGDSRTLEVETGDVDLVLVDGDHTYEGVKIDVERWGRRVRVGGALVLDDAVDEPVFGSHVDTAGRVMQELLDEGDFVLRAEVDRLAHLERVR